MNHFLPCGKRAKWPLERRTPVYNQLKNLFSKIQSFQRFFGLKNFFCFRRKVQRAICQKHVEIKLFKSSKKSRKNSIINSPKIELFLITLIKQAVSETVFWVSERGPIISLFSSCSIIGTLTARPNPFPKFPSEILFQKFFENFFWEIFELAICLNFNEFSWMNLNILRWTRSNPEKDIHQMVQSTSPQGN